MHGDEVAWRFSLVDPPWPRVHSTFVYQVNLSAPVTLVTLFFLCTNRSTLATVLLSTQLPSLQKKPGLMHGCMGIAFLQ